MDATRRQNILLNCNSLDLGQLITLVENGPITIEELHTAGLNQEMVNALELQLFHTLPIEELVEAIQAKRISLEDLLETDLEPATAKALVLKFCNSFKVDELIEFIESEKILLSEFRTAGLKEAQYSSLVEIINKPNPANDRAQKIKKVLEGTATGYEIRHSLNNQIYTIEDLQAAGLKNQTTESIKHFFGNKDDNVLYKIKDLPQTRRDRTDVFFVGMPGSGKSTMLAGISATADQLGIRIPETTNNAGSIYQSKLILDLAAGVLPEGTKKGSYNYIPLAFKNKESGEKHPFNIVEVPGENYVRMNEEGEADEFLKYIETTENKKILIFVIDSVKKGNQGLVYVNILNMFKSRGILHKTDAVYLIVNKFDVVKGKGYRDDNRKEELIAYDYLKYDYLNLLNNLTEAREESKQKFKIKIMPFSIGKISNEYILDDFNIKYSVTILDHLMHDSFVLGGGKWAKNF